MLKLINSKPFLYGGLEKYTNHKLVLISSINESLTKNFATLIKNKLKKCCIIYQSKTTNINKHIEKLFKKYNNVLLCGTDLTTNIDIIPLCHIHICPIKCDNYTDIKNNKSILNHYTKDNLTWNDYWKLLTIMKIDEITYPSEYLNSCDKILNLINLYK